MDLKKFYNKALFYKEFRSSLGFIGIMWLALFYEFSIKFSFLTNRTKGNIQYYIKKSIAIPNNDIMENIFWGIRELLEGFNLVFSIGAIILISFWIVGKERQNKRNEMLATMPFSRNEIIGTKWLLVIIALLIPMVINFILVLLNYSLNTDIYSYYPNMINFILSWFLAKALLYMFIITFIMFISSICGRFFVGGILGSIFLMVPLYLSGVIPVFIEFFCIINDKVVISENAMFQIRLFSERVMYLFNINIFHSDRMDISYFLNPLRNMSIFSIIAALVSLVLLFISFNNNKFEKLNEICMFKSFEYILKIGVATCFALLFAVIFGSSFSYNTINPIEDAYVAGPVAIITFIVAYLITDKIIKYFK